MYRIALSNRPVVMKKMIAACFIVFAALTATSSQKPKRNVLRCIDATYTTIEGIRKVGNVYEFLVETRKDGVRIDSVWFGATPVPCDVHDLRTGHPIRQVLRKGKYMVRANRDLYINYTAEYDSTAAFQRFVPPFNFQGTAYLMYQRNGKRGYTMVSQARKVSGKQLR